MSAGKGSFNPKPAPNLKPRKQYQSLITNSQYEEVISTLSDEKGNFQNYFYSQPTFQCDQQDFNSWQKHDGDHPQWLPAQEPRIRADDKSLRLNVACEDYSVEKLTNALFQKLQAQAGIQHQPPLLNHFHSFQTGEGVVDESLPTNQNYYLNPCNFLPSAQPVYQGGYLYSSPPSLPPQGYTHYPQYGHEQMYGTPPETPQIIPQGRSKVVKKQNQILLKTSAKSKNLKTHYSEATDSDEEVEKNATLAKKKINTKASKPERQSSKNKKSSKIRAKDSSTEQASDEKETETGNSKSSEDDDDDNLLPLTKVKPLTRNSNGGRGHHHHRKRTTNPKSIVTNIGQLRQLGNFISLRPSRKEYALIEEYFINGFSHLNSKFHMKVHSIWEMNQGLVRQRPSLAYSNPPLYPQLSPFNKLTSSIISSTEILLWSKTSQEALSAIVMEKDGCASFYDRSVRALSLELDEIRRSFRQILLLSSVSIEKVERSRKGFRCWRTREKRGMGPRRGCDAVKSVGRYIPDWEENKEILHFQGRMVVPSGKTRENKRTTTYSRLDYNEYILFERRKANVMYAVDVEINPKKYFRA